MSSRRPSRWSRSCRQWADRVIPLQRDAPSSELMAHVKLMFREAALNSIGDGLFTTCKLFDRCASWARTTRPARRRICMWRTSRGTVKMWGAHLEFPDPCSKLGTVLNWEIFIICGSLSLRFVCVRNSTWAKKTASNLFIVTTSFSIYWAQNRELSTNPSSGSLYSHGPWFALAREIPGPRL